MGFVLYGCETWSLTLREEHRLRLFENKVVYLGIYFGVREIIVQENGEIYITLNYVQCKKVSPLQAMKAHGRCGCKGPHIHSHGTRMR